MAKWNEYTTKSAVEDTDELMIADATANVNKRTPLSILWNWIVGKLASAVISQLETNSKSVVGALNELNSNLSSLIKVYSGSYTIQSIGKGEYNLQEITFDTAFSANQYIVTASCTDGGYVGLANIERKTAISCSIRMRNTSTSDLTNRTVKWQAIGI